MNDSMASFGYRSMRYILLALIVAFSAMAIGLLPIVQVAENLLYDLRLTLSPQAQNQTTEIVIAGITEETLSSMPYRSPVDRGLLNRVILDLDEKGARTIALDILFDQPTEPEKDRELRATLSTIDTPVVVALANLENGLLQKQYDYLRHYVKPLTAGYAAVYRNSLDGVVRKFPLREPASGEYGFAAQIARAAGYALPEAAELFIDYQRGRDSARPRFPVYPIHAVALLPRDWIENKIVLIGADLELEDRHATPLHRLQSRNREIPGIEIHAHSIAQLIDGRYLAVPGFGWTFLMAITMTLPGLTISMVGIKKRTQVLLIVIFLLGFWAVAWTVFAAGKIMLNILIPTLALIFASLVSIVRQWRTESANRQFIHRAFSKYLSPDYVNRLVENPEMLEVGGERREITFLFTDLAGFTPLTESLEPRKLVSVINEYLDGTCDIVTRHGGMVASIVGDALHVMFNAPLYQENHAQLAIETALKLDAYCQAFRHRQAAQGVTIEETRIGINTGDGVLGNYGGAKRLEYTAMGDSINTAARLESVNKHLGTRICVSESTVLQCENVLFRPVGRIVLKGKAESIKTFEPVDPDSALIADIESYQSAYDKMAGDDRDARDAFHALSVKFGSDPLVIFHLNRLRDGEKGDLIVMKEK